MTIINNNEKPNSYIKKPSIFIRTHLEMGSVCYKNLPPTGCASKLLLLNNATDVVMNSMLCTFKRCIRSIITDTKKREVHGDNDTS